MTHFVHEHCKLFAAPRKRESCWSVLSQMIVSDALGQHGRP